MAQQRLHGSSQWLLAVAVLVLLLATSSAARLKSASALQEVDAETQLVTEPEGLQEGSAAELFREAVGVRGGRYFCHGLDCPNYDVVDNYGRVELRDYDSAKWITTNTSCRSFDLAVQRGFMRLFEYISGRNQDDKKIEMTTPVVVRVEPDIAGLRPDFAVYFFLPFKYQGEDGKKPPKPTCRDIRIRHIPGHEVFVLPFSGYATGPRVDLLGRLFIRGLRDHGLRVYEDAFFVAIYDSPFRLFHRHNEVWVLHLAPRPEPPAAEDSEGLQQDEADPEYEAVEMVT